MLFFKNGAPWCKEFWAVHVYFVATEYKKKTER